MVNDTLPLKERGSISSDTNLKESNRSRRLLVVTLLGFSSGLPLALLTSTLQAWFASSGASVMFTGMLSLIGLPYIYRLLWGPILDNYSLFALGKRRSWILTMQCALLFGFYWMAACAPNSSPYLLCGIAILMACCSATQDMAIEAHRTEYLHDNESAMGTALAVSAYRVALLLSGGLALIIADYYGWELTYRLVGACMLIGIIGVFLTHEPSTPRPKTSLRMAFTEPLKSLLYKKGFGSLVCFIFFYKLGEAFTATTSGIVMPFLIQGMEFDLATIGYVNKVLGIIGILSGGLLAGLLMLRWSLSRSLLVFGIIQAAANVLFAIMAGYEKNLSLFMFASVTDNIAAGMGSTALVAFFMKIVDRRFTATQFSLLAVISLLPRVISGPLGAGLQAWLGWEGLYQLAVVLALVFIFFLRGALQLQHEAV